MTEQDFSPQDEPQEQKPLTEENHEENHQAEVVDKKEKHPNDPLDALTWGLILIWAGFIFLASNLGWLEQIRFQPLGIDGIGTWPAIFIGIGLLVFLEAIIRSLIPAYRASIAGNLFTAAISLGIGLGMVMGFQLVWPFILIAMGLSAIASALLKHRK